MRRIVTWFQYPPIPWRDFDWAAYYEGEEELGNYGYGKTEYAAIQDLKALNDDEDEPEAPK